MTEHVEGSIVRIRINFITPVLAAGAAAAIATAPTASATPDDHLCSSMGGSTQCQRTGNVQIYTTPQATPAPTNSVYGPFVGYHNGRN
jgi:hypothetical protein